jgi:hypothetical protein
LAKPVLSSRLPLTTPVMVWPLMLTEPAGRAVPPMLPPPSGRSRITRSKRTPVMPLAAKLATPAPRFTPQT